MASDLGETVPKRAMQEEGQRRWAIMGESEKVGWGQAYQYSFRLCQPRLEFYKSGKLDVKNMTDDEALAYANARPNKNNDSIPVEDIILNAQDAIAAQVAQSTVPEPWAAHCVEI